MAVNTERAGHLFLLVWLKAKLMGRLYNRSFSSVVGAVLALLLFAPLAIGVAFLFGLGFHRLAPPWNEHLLRSALLGIYLVWLLVPLMGYTLNDAYDITRLFGYPLSIRRIFTGVVLGALLDLSTLLALPTLTAVVIGFTRGAFSLVFILLTAALFLFHTLALSQALLLLSAGVLRSRRFRDFVLVLLPLFWMGYYLATQTLSRGTLQVDWRRLFQSSIWEALSFLPPGLAARGIAAAGRGEWTLALVFLPCLVAATLGTVVAAGWLIRLTYAGEAVGIPARKRDTVSPQSRSGRKIVLPRQRAFFADVLPPVVEAMADKEVKYLLRDPYFKVALMNMAYILIVGVFLFLRGSEQGVSLEQATPAMLWGAAGLLLFGQTNLLFNMWGNEGGAAPVLFGFPGARRQMLVGKNLTLFTALFAINAVFLLILCTAAGALAQFGVLFGAAALALVVLLALGNLVSIWFPYRVVLKGWRIRQPSAGRGFSYGLLYLGITLGAATLLLPVAAAFVVPAFFVHGVWFAATIPVAVFYAAGLYMLSLQIAAPLLMQRELPLLEKLTEEEG